MASMIRWLETILGIRRRRLERARALRRLIRRERELAELGRRYIEAGSYTEARRILYTIMRTERR